jgi:hypothetical protein
LVYRFQACAEVLGGSESTNYMTAVHGLARWYLIAVQNQLNTVVSASQLLALVHQPKKRRTERKMVIPDFPMEVQHPDTIVKVLEPGDIEQPVRMKKSGADLETTTGYFTNSDISINIFPTINVTYTKYSLSLSIFTLYKS